MIIMSVELCNPHVFHILIAVRKKDSIHALAQRISLSYGWTYKWVHELMKKGVFKTEKMKIKIQKTNKFYQKMMKFMHEMFRNDVQFYYEAIGLFGISYCFTATDAVFIWTKGGYNIGRYKEYYPVFVNVAKKDKFFFEEYCKKCGLSLKKRNGVFYSVTYVDTVVSTRCDTIPVDSLKETIDFMKKNHYNFEPALEMIAEMCGKEASVKYKEVVTNV